MNVQNIWKIYKKYRNFIEGKEEDIYELRNKKKINILNDLMTNKIDFDKYFASNILRRKNFYIYNIPNDKSMEYYFDFDEWLCKKQKKWFENVNKELLNLCKIDLNDRDMFLKLFNNDNLKVFSVLYPDFKELLESINDNIRNKSARYYLLMKRMHMFVELEEKIKNKLLT